MNSSAATLLLTPSSSSINLTSFIGPKPFFAPQTSPRTASFTPCRATRQSNPIADHGFNLYELLGIEMSSNQAQIKEAYRALQKRCHPDIAGPPGHDMAIVLNDAYALLNDPAARMAYDKELAKVSDLQGYTGKPIYSAWFGSENEERAVFVDEVKCVGCLKCALCAEKTFAVESVYGRARVVAQWADPVDKIQEAIGACPVDCISMVERSNLAALEFIMSKQPRGRVRIGASNTAGERIADVFDEMEKFMARYAKHQASTAYSEESEAYRASKMSAIQAIQMISNWIYWQSPRTDATATPPAIIPPSAKKHAGPSIKRLKAAAAARNQARTTKQTSKLSSNSYEYWRPSALELPEAAAIPDHDSNATISPKESRKMSQESISNQPLRPEDKAFKPFRVGIPIVAAIFAASVVRLQIGESVGGIRDHVGGSLALQIVNSPQMQVVLTGVTWYLIGMYAVELAAAFRRK